MERIMQIPQRAFLAGSWQETARTFPVYTHPEEVFDLIVAASHGARH